MHFFVFEENEIDYIKQDKRTTLYRMYEPFSLPDQLTY